MMIATASPRIPYQIGISGFIPGMPRTILGEGALSLGIELASMADQTTKKSMITMQIATMTIPRDP